MINEALNSSPPLQLTQFYARQLHQLHRQDFYPELLCMRATVCIFTMYTSLCIITSPCTRLHSSAHCCCTRTMQYAVSCSGLGAPPSCSMFSDPPFAEGQHTKLEYTSTPIGLLVDYSLQNTLSNKYCEADAGCLAIGTLSSAPPQPNAAQCTLCKCPLQLHKQEQNSNI